MQPINYTEKGTGLHEAIRDAGHALVEENGIWLADDALAVQAIIDGYDALSAARASKWEEIKVKREAVKYAGVPIASVGKTIDTDEGARTQQLGLVLMGAAMPAALRWKFADNTMVPMTPALAQEVLATTAARDTAVFSVAEGYRATINAMTDWQAVLNLDISAGWPV